MFFSNIYSTDNANQEPDWELIAKIEKGEEKNFSDNIEVIKNLWNTELKTTKEEFDLLFSNIGIFKLKFKDNKNYEINYGDKIFGNHFDIIKSVNPYFDDDYCKWTNMKKNNNKKQIIFELSSLNKINFTFDNVSYENFCKKHFVKQNFDDVIYGIRNFSKNFKYACLVNTYKQLMASILKEKSEISSKDENELIDEDYFKIITKGILNVEKKTNDKESTYTITFGEYNDKNMNDEFAKKIFYKGYNCKYQTTGDKFTIYGSEKLINKIDKIRFGYKKMTLSEIKESLKKEIKKLDEGLNEITIVLIGKDNKVIDNNEDYYKNNTEIRFYIDELTVNKDNGKLMEEIDKKLKGIDNVLNNFLTCTNKLQGSIKSKPMDNFDNIKKELSEIEKTIDPIKIQVDPNGGEIIKEIRNFEIILKGKKNNITSIYKKYLDTFVKKISSIKDGIKKIQEFIDATILSKNTDDNVERIKPLIKEKTDEFISEIENATRDNIEDVLNNRGLEYNDFMKSTYENFFEGIAITYCDKNNIKKNLRKNLCNFFSEKKNIKESWDKLNEVVIKKRQVLKNKIKFRIICNNNSFKKMCDEIKKSLEVEYNNICANTVSYLSVSYFINNEINNYEGGYYRVPFRLVGGENNESDYSKSTKKFGQYETITVVVGGSCFKKIKDQFYNFEDEKGDYRNKQEEPIKFKDEQIKEINEMIAKYEKDCLKEAGTKEIKEEPKEEIKKEIKEEEIKKEIKEEEIKKQHKKESKKTSEEEVLKEKEKEKHEEESTKKNITETGSKNGCCGKCCSGNDKCCCKAR